MIAGAPRPAIAALRVWPTRFRRVGRSLSGSRSPADLGAAGGPTTTSRQAGPRPGRCPDPNPGAGTLLAPGFVAGFDAERRALLADLEVQRSRLVVLAELLLELGRRGESVAALNIADGLTRVAARLVA